MKNLKVIFDTCLIILTTIALCVSLAYGYYTIFVHETTTGVNYISNQSPVDLIEKSEDLTDEELKYYEDRYLFNINYYSNDNKNGIEVQEMQLNYFTDQTLNANACRSTGMQYVGNFQGWAEERFVDNEEQADDYVAPDFTYYDTTNMISWTGGKLATQLNRDKKFIIKIADNPFQLQLTQKTDYYSKFLWWDIHTKTTYSTYASVFYDIFKVVQNNDYGYGDFYITLDLSYYFTVYEYDQEKGKWIEDNITDDIFTYAICKIHYDKNGLSSSNQSLFGMINGDSSYGVIDATYWQERFIYNLNELNINNNLFDIRYSDIYDGYFISLTLDSKTMFENIDREKLNITLNLNSEYLVSNNINIVGIDYNGFQNCNIDTLSIIGDSQDFYLLDKSLLDTNLKTLKYSNGINLIISDNAINSEYSGVVL